MQAGSFSGIAIESVKLADSAWVLIRINSRKKFVLIVIPLGRRI